MLITISTKLTEDEVKRIDAHIKGTSFGSRSDFIRHLVRQFFESGTKKIESKKEELEEPTSGWELMLG